MQVNNYQVVLLVVCPGKRGHARAIDKIGNNVGGGTLLLSTVTGNFLEA